MAQVGSNKLKLYWSARASIKIHFGLLGCLKTPKTKQKTLDDSLTTYLNPFINNLLKLQTWSIKNAFINNVLTWFCIKWETNENVLKNYSNIITLRNRKDKYQLKNFHNLLTQMVLIVHNWAINYKKIIY